MQPARRPAAAGAVNHLVLAALLYRLFQQSVRGQAIGVASGAADMIGEVGLALWFLVVGTRRMSSNSPEEIVVTASV